MKKKFSTKWKSSRQKRKQRKYFLEAPLHIKHRFLSAPFSKELRKKYGKRNIPIRKGDEVLVMRGALKKKKAKVASVELKKTRVVLEGLQRTKKDGTKINVYFHPSKLQIQSLNLEDKERVKALERVKQEAKEKPGGKDASDKS
ncbi:50S ribosomal protein L24 [Candidatus Pacearchaeota archaeon]|nr:50S ribosomal protein L24 [Candidatus Pacearchaeota archaeon]